MKKYEDYKPQGYWRNIKNVIAELKVISASTPHPDQMPTFPLIRSKNPTLVNAIFHFGGVHKVAKKAGLVATAPKKPKYKSRGYWHDINNVLAEVKKIAANTETPKEMPNFAVIRAHAPSLVNAVFRFGGMKSLARRAGLLHTKKSRSKRQTLPEVVKQLKGVIKKHKLPSTHMPSMAALHKLGEENLVKDIRHHGGVQKVAAASGLTIRRDRPNFWLDLEKVRKLLMEVLEKNNLPNDTLPSMSTLKSLSPYNWSRGIYLHGGMESFAKKMGLKTSQTPRNFWSNEQNIVKQVRKVIREQGLPRNRFLSCSQMQKNGLQGAALAIYKRYGSVHTFALKHGFTPTRPGRKKS